MPTGLPEMPRRLANDGFTSATLGEVMESRKVKLRPETSVIPMVCK